MQFRKHLPGAKLHDLLEIFKSRKEFFLEMIAKSELLGKKQACLRTGNIVQEPL
jgi:hypothetical protein